MFKVTPNPPDTDPVPHDFPPRKPSTIFLIDPKVDNETLLAHACESLASASVMASDFAGFLEGPQRNTLLGIQQVIMLGELAVNRVLDNLDPPVSH
ncbi:MULTISPECIES: DUF6124 family protein [Pseudomonas]|jgi:hypothetical protein|uniref:DUF6124 family protein n=1 Tax=Pseudomonas TaxID=286 RepID=UPI0028677F87|nr:MULTISPECIES: DUF6124 family protein [Pseudomonas]MDR6925250.1 hypothetical protein [Pseudomonas sp. BE134]MDR7281269.1 hypothetical protein [Pseudomonas corrugata]